MKIGFVSSDLAYWFEIMPEIHNVLALEWCGSVFLQYSPTYITVYYISLIDLVFPAEAFYLQ